MYSLMWTKKCIIPRIQPTDCKKQNGPNEEVSISVIRRKEIITGGREWEESLWDRGGGKAM